MYEKLIYLIYYLILFTDTSSDNSDGECSADESDSKKLKTS